MKKPEPKNIIRNYNKAYLEGRMDTLEEIEDYLKDNACSDSCHFRFAIDKIRELRRKPKKSKRRNK